VNKLKVEFYRCESFDRRVVLFSEEAWFRIKRAIEAIEVEVLEEEIAHPFYSVEPCQARQLVKSVYEVQGMERKEGESFLPALESLVVEYSKLK
jgi:hypothetical protein